MRPGVLVVAAGVLVMAVGILGLASGLNRPRVTGAALLTPVPRITHTPPLSRPTCRSTLQAEIDAARAGATLDLRGCTYAAGGTINQPLAIIGAMIHVPAGQTGITVRADDVTLDGVTIIGTQSDLHVFDEIGVAVMATPARPIHRLTIRNSEIAQLGGFGGYLRNVADLRLEGNHVRDIVYAGLMVLSGAGGTIEGNVVQRIGVRGSEANGGNAYGIVLTMRGEGEPASSGFMVHRNTVEDVPTWHALDTHGGRDIVFSENTVRRSMRAVFVTTDEAGNQPTNVAIINNQLLDPAPIESNVVAVTLYRADGVAITGNTVVGWGVGGFVRDFGDLSVNLAVDGNTVVP